MATFQTTRPLKRPYPMYSLLWGLFFCIWVNANPAKIVPVKEVLPESLYQYPESATEFYLPDFEPVQEPSLNETLKEDVSLEHVENEPPLLEVDSQQSDQVLEKFENTQQKRDLFQFRKNVRKYKIPDSTFDEILKSPTAIFLLKSKSPLYSIKENKFFKLNKDIYVKIHTKINADGYQYIKGKDGKTQYIVHSNYLHSIKDITQLEAEPKNFTTYDIPPNYADLDDSIHLLTQVNSSFDKMKSPLLNALSGVSQDRTVDSFQFEIDLNTKWGFVFDVGTLLQYTQGEITITAQKDTTLRNLSVGAYIRKEFINSELFSFAAKLGMKRSFWGSIETIYGRYNYSQNTFFASLENIWKTRLGNWMIGANCNYHLLRLGVNPQSIPSNLDLREEQAWSWSLHLGYLIELVI